MSDFGIFEVDAWGDPVGEGASDARYCTMEGIAKLNAAGRPYVVANEFICGRLGLMLGLPIPPGMVVTTDVDQLAYVAMRFGHKADKPPPVIPEHVVADNPTLAAGVVAFDCWVWNPDRHAKNLAYVRDVVPLTLFDHSHALLGTDSGVAIQNLTDNRDLPLVTGCLPPVLKDASAFAHWSERIKAVHLEALRDVCRFMVRPGGLTLDEAEAVIGFLNHRKERILDMLKTSTAALPQVTQWGLV